MSEPSHDNDRGDDFTASVEQLWNSEEQHYREFDNARPGESMEQQP